MLLNSRGNSQSFQEHVLSEGQKAGDLVTKHNSTTHVNIPGKGMNWDNQKVVKEAPL